jgi:ribosomal-protein-alanine N-acetyltransferase
MVSWEKPSRRSTIWVMADIIRPLVASDAEALLALRIANCTFMAPYDPARDDSFFTLERQREIARNQQGLAFAILDGGLLAGTIALSNLAYGPFRSASVGYWVDQKRNGRGLASLALTAMVDHAFFELGLHRLETATLTDNVASRRVLEENRFEPIGVARRYLHINGARRDHILFQRTNDD